MQDAADIPQDLESCQALCRELQQELEKYRRLLSQMAHGARSEKRILSDPNQRLLPFEDDAEFREAREEAVAEAQEIIETYTVQRRARQTKPRSEALPKGLPRIEQIVEAAESDRVCPTHGPRALIGYDETETLCRKPAELFVRVTKYPKYACPTHAECGVASPERPTPLVEGNRYDTSVAATIVEGKWFHYQPIYRQQDQFAASGWTPSRSTLLNIVAQTAFVLAPLVALMRKRVQQDVAVGLDDTSCRMLLPKDLPAAAPWDPKLQRLIDKAAEARAKGQNSLLAKMWAYSGLHHAPYNIFDFRVSRHRDGPDDFFRDSRCWVQGDCFSGNLSVTLESAGRLTFVACWAHARRKVVDAQTYQEESRTLLGMIQALYDIETRGKALSCEERQRLRERESTVVLAAIRRWLDSAPLSQVLPKSDFAEAVRYIRNHWEALNVYVRDGRLPIDNNSVEQLMKQVALGRKAWLFVGNVSAGEQSAMLMSLVSSAKRHDLDVWLYIKDVLDQLLAGCTDCERLLPDVWKQSHPEAIRLYRVAERRDKAERKQYRAAQRRVAR